VTLRSKQIQQLLHREHVHCGTEVCPNIREQLPYTWMHNKSVPCYTKAGRAHSAPHVHNIQRPYLSTEKTSPIHTISSTMNASW
jgi:hypothetical protein